MSATARPRLASGSRLSAKQNDPTSLQNGNPAFNGVDNHPDCPPSRWTGSEFASTRPPGVAGTVQTPSDFRRRTKTVYHAPNRREHRSHTSGGRQNAPATTVPGRNPAGTPQRTPHEAPESNAPCPDTRSFFQAESERILAYRNEPTTRAFH